MLICTQCGKTYLLNERIWKCQCGGTLAVDFHARFPLKKIVKRAHTMWRYREALPLQHDANIVSFNEGFTPLVEVPLKDTSVLCKQEHLFPTGSFKDRGAAMLISKVKELGIQKVVEDSSGNAGSAIAAYSAKADIDCQIFIPESASSEKVNQIHAYGAKVTKIQGDRGATAEVALQAAKSHYYASHSWNPFFFQGTKTFAYEIYEQLGWNVPDTVILPVGNGTLLLGTYIGFNDLLQAHRINALPKLIGIQAANCAPLYHAYQEEVTESSSIEKRDTVAKGIAIKNPIRAKQILNAVKRTEGWFITVKEEEIRETLLGMCRNGFYIEPTASATIAGVKKYLENVHTEKEVVVTALTGHGLKASSTIADIIDG
ncbi:MAG: threonine synthase [Candidatus Thorarchaeota archaeon]|nr:threonine synthase [Candidatus Thorarchaeota archaeon]NIW14329.1 threonine synthase [Candidatus Thorarchaeota archaeon]NIW52426.1 threonine synthase [Candidatus Korarchaeota archaeon]